MIWRWVAICNLKLQIREKPVKSLRITKFKACQIIRQFIGLYFILYTQHSHPILHRLLTGLFIWEQTHPLYMSGHQKCLSSKWNQQMGPEREREQLSNILHNKTRGKMEKWVIDNKEVRLRRKRSDQTQGSKFIQLNRIYDPNHQYRLEIQNTLADMINKEFAILQH